MSKDTRCMFNKKALKKFNHAYLIIFLVKKDLDNLLDTISTSTRKLYTIVFRIYQIFIQMF